MDARGEAGLDQAVASHYAEGREQPRLAAGAGRLEFVRTRELLDRFLPSPPAVVLDVGGAAGVHGLPLAARGYAVHLVDPVPLHVDLARSASAAQADAPLASVSGGDARRLDRPDRTVDAVLLLGPLYHLTERDERVAALREARRVLRPGGVLVAAAISRFAPTYDGLFRGYLDQDGFEAIVERDVAEGQHRNPTNHPRWFTTAYLHRPDELAAHAEPGAVRSGCGRLRTRFRPPSRIRGDGGRVTSCTASARRRWWSGPSRASR